MSALNLYHNLIVQGFKLSIVNEDKLELVPASRLTDSQRTAIKQHKSELLSLLAANESYSPLEEVKPYTQDELNRLLNQVAKPLFFHLIDCQQCSLEDARYCGDGFGLGNTFDDLLMCFDDAADKRYKLMNQVIKARVSGHRVYMLLKT